MVRERLADFNQPIPSVLRQEALDTIGSRLWKLASRRARLYRGCRGAILPVGSAPFPTPYARF